MRGPSDPHPQADQLAKISERSRPAMQSTPPDPPHQPARQTMFSEMQHRYFHDTVDWLFAKSGSLSIVRVFALID